MAAEPLTREDALAEVSRLLAERVGFQAGERLAYRLEAAVAAACRELGSDPAELARTLAGAGLDHPAWETVLGHVTVGETYFFRDHRQFEALTRVILPALLEARRGDRRLNVWSAACASGEEAYSLAMVLRELVDPAEGWEISILASDVNPEALRRGREGLYRPWSFRRMPEELMRRHFVPEGGLWRVRDELRGMVCFERHNLLDPPDRLLPRPDGGFDLVLCRNVLMYMPPPLRHRVAEGLAAALRPEGRLMVAAVELDRSLFPSLTQVREGGVAVYRWPQAGGAPPKRRPEAPPRRISRPSAPTRPAAARSSVARPGTGRRRPPRRLPERREPGPALETADALADRARRAADAGRASEAMEAAERAITLDPLCGRAYHVLGLLALERGDLAAATEALRRALYVDPSLVGAHVGLMTVAARRGRLDAAARHRELALAALAALPPDGPVPGEPGVTARELREALGEGAGGGS